MSTDFEYGELNTLLDTQGRGAILEDGSPTSILRQTIKKANSDSDISPGPYKGIVLRVDTIPMGWWENLKRKLGDPTSASYMLKVRVPELDAHIPAPSQYVSSKATSADKRVIDLHRTYYPRIPTQAQPTEGDVVWVDFLNGKNVFLDSLSVGEQTVAAPKEKPKGEGKKKSKKSKKNPNSPGPQPQETEIQKWKSRSGLGNPKNIDIITKSIDGRKITLSRETMKKYEKFFTEVNTKLGSEGLPLIAHKSGESFRVYESGGGKFKSGLRNSIHNFGNAVDLSPKAMSSGKFKKTVDIVVKTAQSNGFIRFGISKTTIHMDTGSGASEKRPEWWIYHSGKINYIGPVRTAQAKRMLSQSWIATAATQKAPPSL